jgi:amidase
LWIFILKDYFTMSIQRPSLADLDAAGARLGLQLDAPLLNEYAGILEAVWQDYDRLDRLGSSARATNRHPATTPTTPGT